MQALLDTLCSAVTSGHKTGQTSPAATSFYCAIVLEVLAATPAPYPDSLIQLLLPHMVVGLAPSAATSLRLATLTIAACMMTMTSLADQVTVSLVTDACTNVTAATLRETLQFVAAACDTQRSMRGGFQGGPEGGQGGAPRSAAAALLKQPALLHEISRMQREKWRIEALIAALVACGAPASDPAGTVITMSRIVFVLVFLSEAQKIDLSSNHFCPFISETLGIAVQVVITLRVIILR